MTITDTRLLVVSAEAMLRELHDNMSFTFNMLSSMSRHLRKSITLVHQLSALSSTERLADFLLSLCDSSQGEVRLTLPHDKSLIAARLGMQPETFSRALAKLKSAGVSNCGHDVVIRSLDTLRDYIKHKSMGCG